MKTVITADHLFTPTQLVDGPVVLIDDGRVVDVGSRQAKEVPGNARHLDFPGLALAPGFIDIHVHGGAGHDVMEADDAALAAIERHMAKHGVTGYLATTVTAPTHRILKALDHLGRSIGGHGRPPQRAVPLGIHLEGPFISHAKRGVHPQENLVPPSTERLEAFWQASLGTIRMMTVAPEIPGAIETIHLARTLGIHSSLGHSDANYDQARAAIAAGARHATHTFNAMRALDHRDPGILGALLTDASVTADIIVDGVHVDPTIVDLFVRAKGVEEAILITDAISATGMPDGTYLLGEIEVRVHDGRCESNGRLAGSVLTLDRAIRNTVKFAHVSLQDAIRMATINPAKVLGIEKQKGALFVGADADIVVFTATGEVIRTIVGGVVS